MKQAGVACHWNREIVDESGGKDLEITTGKEEQKGLAVGDIVKVSYGQHHFMVIDPVKKGFIRSIEGNAGAVWNTGCWQQIGWEICHIMWSRIFNTATG